MKGKTENVTCQICLKEMSFGRIKSHIKARHNDVITVEEYVNNFYLTLPLHNLCTICNSKAVYKYKTCSKECSSIQRTNSSKGIPKPEGFMDEAHKKKLSMARMGGKGHFAGKQHTEETKHILRERMLGQKLHLGHSQSEYQKLKASEGMLKYYSEGNEPWTKNNPHTPETISKIISHRPMNNLESLVGSVLSHNNIPYIFQFYLNRDGIVKSYDFKVGKILLEIDGDYYHGGPGCKKHFFKLDEVKANDELKTKLALSNGYLLLRFWESDIKRNPNIIIEKLHECI